MGILDTWDRYKFSRQLLMASSLAAGLVIVSLGVRFDEEHRWESLAFAPNIVAALGGFLIGAPVALVALSTFTREQEDQVNLQRVNTLTLIAWTDFKDAVFDYCRPEFINALTTEADAVQATHDDIIGRLKSYIDVRNIENDPVRMPTEEEYQDVRQYILTRVDILKKQIASVNERLTPPARFEVDWAGLQGTWSTLDSDVRLQRTERGLRWFNRSSHYDFRYRMARPENPLSALFANHSAGYQPHHTRSMNAIPKAIRQHAEMTKGDLDSKLWSSGSLAFENASDYAQLANEAGHFLTALRTTVRVVELENWPQNATEPV